MAAAFPGGEPAEVAEYLGRYRTRYYANGYALTFEYAMAVEDEGPVCGSSTGSWPPRS